MYTDLVGQTAAHLHAGPAGDTGGVALSLPVGSINMLVLPITLGLVPQLLSGNIYINVHTAAYPATGTPLRVRARVCVCVGCHLVRTPAHAHPCLVCSSFASHSFAMCVHASYS